MVVLGHYVTGYVAGDVAVLGFPFGAYSGLMDGWMVMVSVRLMVSL